MTQMCYVTGFRRPLKVSLLDILSATLDGNGDMWIIDCESDQLKGNSPKTSISSINAFKFPPFNVVIQTRRRKAVDSDQNHNNTFLSSSCGKTLAERRCQVTSSVFQRKKWMLDLTTILTTLVFLMTQLLESIQWWNLLNISNFSSKKWFWKMKTHHKTHQARCLIKINGFMALKGLKKLKPCENLV